MSHEFSPFGHFSLSRGFYRIEACSDDIRFFDSDSQFRGSLLKAGIRYYLHVTDKIDKGVIHSDLEIPSSGKLKIIRIPAIQFFLVLLLSAGRRHVMQKFGTNERLLAFSKDKAGLALAAHRNAEFRSLRSYRLDDESICDLGWDWLKKGWTRRSLQTFSDRPEGTSGFRICIYVHMHYWETWPEIETVLLNDCHDFRLIVTSTTEREEDFIRIRNLFPDCLILITENRGRDIGPFMDLLGKGMFGHYDAVCKIHGKLSKKDGMKTVSGERIRRYSLACLLADGAYQQAVTMFASNPDIGMAGPANLQLPPDGQALLPYIHTELVWINKVIRRSKTMAQWQTITFFAGTMFWFRPEALTALSAAQIGIDEFSLENGAKRGTLQHAIERVFGLFTKQAGYKVAPLSPLSPETKGRT
jgi:Rhamnan synthesis protein F